MDPQTALDEARKALARADYRHAAEYLQSYLEWRERGGFEPHNGDALWKELARQCQANIQSISTRRALALLTRWHRGQWCAMYAAQSSGLVKSWSELLTAIQSIANTHTRYVLRRWVQRAARVAGDKERNANDGRRYYSVRSLLW
jgi:hypothetical protein